MKDALDHPIVPFSRCSLLTDSAIPQQIKESERVVPRTPFHRCGVAFCFGTLIAAVTIHDFTSPGEVDLAIMYRCRGRFELAYEAKLGIHFAVELVAKIGFAALLRP